MTETAATPFRAYDLASNKRHGSALNHGRERHHAPTPPSRLDISATLTLSDTLL
jgi:hypothetical protein